MATIISFANTASLQNIRKSAETIVLAGGCFDLLHNGHKAFLKKAKQEGEFLIILLESDAMIQKRKGISRPHETQQKRAANLSREESVDMIILLPSQMENHDYDKLVSELKPAIIATTQGDPGRYHKERQGDLVGAQVKDVIARLPEHSTTMQLKTHVNK